MTLIADVVLEFGTPMAWLDKCLESLNRPLVVCINADIKALFSFIF